MAIMLDEPDQLTPAVRALREWQSDTAALQLHPGDLGWHCRFGIAETVAAVRTWRRDGRIVAVGLLDSPTVLRLTVAPEVRRDRGVAEQIAADLAGVLPAGAVSVESPTDAVLDEVLGDHGWKADEPWAPLRRDLTEPVADPGIAIETIGPERAHEWVGVVRASFDRSTFTVECWHTMATAETYADARCLLGRDDHGTAVAAVAVWSAGAGRPGLLEPLGVHRDHRGHGYGRAISVAAAAALRDMGSSSADVCTPGFNVAAVATYKSAGFRALPERLDRKRE